MLFSIAGAFFSGFYSRAKQRFNTNPRLQVPIMLSKAYKACEPWSRHFNRHTITSVNAAFENGDIGTATFLAEIGTTETADPWCVALAVESIGLAAKFMQPHIEGTVFNIDNGILGDQL